MINDKQKYIIQVAPFIRLSFAGRQTYSYYSSSPIARGSLVEIPFYRRNIPGIAVESRNDFPRKGNFEIKPVKRIIAEKMLSEKQMAFAQKISGRYLSPLGTVLKCMVPKIAKSGKKKSENPPDKEIVKKNGQAEKIMGAKEKEFTLIGKSGERDRIIFSLMKRALENKKQFLWLSSEVIPAVSFFSALKRRFPADNLALIHGGVPKGEYYAAWKRIKEGKAKIIIASKMGIFLPFRELGAVAVEESGDVSHKQWDMNPRYDAAHAARALAEIHGAKLIFSNAVPSVEIWKKEREKKIRMVMAVPDKPDKPDGPEIKIANIFDEKKSADFPVGKKLYQSLAKTLSEKRKALLIVNRKGFSSYSVCQGCKTILRCPDCDRAMVYFEEKEKYKCLHCSRTADLLSACPVCGACRFSHQGIGIQLVEKKIERLFPEAGILRLDADVSKSRKKSADVLGALAKGRFDVLVGTQIALKIRNSGKFSLVALPDFDNLGSLPDFKSREQVWAMLAQAEGLAGNDGEFLIQTVYPDDFLLSSFRNRNTAEFFERELDARKKTANPPFRRLVKIFFRDSRRKKTDAETKKVFDLLSRLADSSIDISEPYEPFSAKRRGFYRKNILIRTKPGTDIRKTPVFPVLGGLKKGWTIDVDPVSTV